MAFDPNLSTLKDHLRFAVGDIEATEIFPDAIYTAKLAVRAYPQALAEICDALCSKFAQEPDQYDQGGATGGGKAVWTERIKAWRDLAKLARDGKVDTPVLGTRRNRASIAVMKNPDLEFLEDLRPRRL